MSEETNKPFETWLRSVCFQKPPAEAYDLAKGAWEESARQLMDREPKNSLMTSDGVKVVPRMEVHYWEPGRKYVEISIVLWVGVDGWLAFNLSCPHFIQDGSVPYFSTRKLAMKHRAKILQEEADKAKEEAK